MASSPSAADLPPAMVLILMNSILRKKPAETKTPSRTEKSMLPVAGSMYNLTVSISRCIRGYFFFSPLHVILPLERS